MTPEQRQEIEALIASLQARMQSGGLSPATRELWFERIDYLKEQLEKAKDG